mgnify:FL=1
MKNQTFSKLSCAVAIGLLMPLGVVTASEAYEGLQSSFGEGSAMEPSQYEAVLEPQGPAVLAPEGAEGPIRDMTEDTAPMTDYKPTQDEIAASKQAMEKGILGDSATP